MHPAPLNFIFKKIGLCFIGYFHVYSALLGVGHKLIGLGPALRDSQGARDLSVCLTSPPECESVCIAASPGPGMMSRRVSAE